MRDNDLQYDEQPGGAGRNGPGLFLVLTILVAAITAVFISQNRERTSIEFLLFDFNSRTWVAIAISIGLGVLLDRLFLAWWRRARKRKNES
ncbi:MAG: putative integral membrane protein [Ilumatobacter sp.]